MKFTQMLSLMLLLGLAGGCAKSPVDGHATDAAAKEPPAKSDTEAGEEAEPKPSAAAIAPEAARRAGIDVASAGPAQIRETLTLYGSIRSNAEREQEIRARYPGIVRSIAKRAGDRVSKGEELLTVESNESLQVYPIRSPLGGQVLDRRTNSGNAVDSSTVLMIVADMSTVWAEFSIFARDLGQIRPGMRVLFRGTSAAESAEATISYVAPAGQADTQSVVARAVVENRGGRWVPGQFITGDIVTAVAKVPVAVQPIALQQLSGKTMVFVQTARGFEARPVEVGKRSEEAVEIVKGLVAGERYATTNSYLIKADLMKSEADED